MVDDALAEHVGVVERVEGDAEGGGGATRVLPRLVGTAAARRIDIAA